MAAGARCVAWRDYTRSGALGQVGKKGESRIARAIHHMERALADIQRQTLRLLRDGRQQVIHIKWLFDEGERQSLALFRRDAR